MSSTTFFDNVYSNLKQNIYKIISTFFTRFLIKTKQNKF